MTITSKTYIFFFSVKHQVSQQNAGSNAEHRMSPCPPNYANKNSNKIPMSCHANAKPTMEQPGPCS